MRRRDRLVAQERILIRLPAKTSALFHEFTDKTRWVKLTNRRGDIRLLWKTDTAVVTANKIDRHDPRLQMLEQHNLVSYDRENNRLFISNPYLPADLEQQWWPKRTPPPPIATQPTTLVSPLVITQVVQYRPRQSRGQWLTAMLQILAQQALLCPEGWLKNLSHILTTHAPDLCLGTASQRLLNLQHKGCLERDPTGLKRFRLTEAGWRALGHDTAPKLPPVPAKPVLTPAQQRELTALQRLAEYTQRTQNKVIQNATGILTRVFDYGLEREAIQAILRGLSAQSYIEVAYQRDDQTAIRITKSGWKMLGHERPPTLSSASKKRRT
ncbi:hypothetical protein HY933_03075 [Candidatus Falkowbacteria bacterium]|nr:hypothetical protein [Candidatus Falkowbacteria bacterium]